MPRVNEEQMTDLTRQESAVGFSVRTEGFAGSDSGSVRSRVAIVDMLRGLMIVLMILDHTREYFHFQALLFQPTDVDRTNVGLFASRWVTHLCAPTFVLLSGVSIWLQKQGGKIGFALSRFLLARGLWLIALELTVVVFALNFAYPFVFLQVIWAIGVGMVLMAGAVWLPRNAVLLLGAAVIVAGEALNAAVPASTSSSSWEWAASLLIRPGTIGSLPGFSAYPALPWFGIMALGYGMGPALLAGPDRRTWTLAGLGSGLLVAFLAIRLLNGYGDPSPWSPSPDAADVVMSFLNVSKYPPSLAFTLATLGVSLVLAPLVERIGGAPGRLLTVFGRVPLLVYVLHLYLVHGLALGMGAAAGYRPSLFLNFLGDSSALKASGWGVSLPLVLIIWIAVVLALWPLATWYAGVKSQTRAWWASYL